jgi:hypothetical protein
MSKEKSDKINNKEDLVKKAIDKWFELNLQSESLMDHQKQLLTNLSTAKLPRNEAKIHELNEIREKIIKIEIKKLQLLDFIKYQVKTTDPSYFHEIFLHLLEI